MKNKTQYIIATALFFAFVASGVFAAETPRPSCTPPDCNADEPINVGSGAQTKTGFFNLGKDLSVEGAISVGGSPFLNDSDSTSFPDGAVVANYLSSIYEIIAGSGVTLSGNRGGHMPGDGTFYRYSDRAYIGVDDILGVRIGATNSGGIELSSSDHKIAELMDSSGGEEHGILQLYANGTLNTRIGASSAFPSFINNGANFGIGTNTPLKKFHVVGPMLSTGTDARLTFGPSQTGAGAFDSASTPIWSIDNYNDTFRIFREPNLTTIGTTWFTVKNTGDVVIKKLEGTGDRMVVAKPDGTLSAQSVGAVPNLQSVSDAGATTTKAITVGGLTSTGVVSINPQDSGNEGGEMRLVGSSNFGSIQIDNYAGNLRVHTLANGKDFQILGGGAYNKGVICGQDSTACLNFNDNNWIYVGDTDGGVYGGRGIATGNLWVDSGGTAYLTGRVCIGDYNNSSNCRTSWPAAAATPTLQAVTDMGNTTDKTLVIPSIILSKSDIYFTDTNHSHTGIGNDAGYAAIENAANYNTLMILGRANGIGGGRSVSIWDRLDVNGTLVVNGGATITNNLSVQGETTVAGRLKINFAGATSDPTTTGVQLYNRTDGGSDKLVLNAPSIGFRTNLTENLLISTNGNTIINGTVGSVGIGRVPTSGYKLDVNGNVNIENSLRIESLGSGGYQNVCATQDGTLSVSVDCIPDMSSQPHGATGYFKDTSSDPNYETWTVPGGVYHITVQLWGADGGRQSGVTPGVGGYSESSYYVDPGQVIRYIIGYGGNPGGGLNGGNSVFCFTASGSCTTLVSTGGTNAVGSGNSGTNGTGSYFGESTSGNGMVSGLAPGDANAYNNCTGICIEGKDGAILINW